MRLDAWVDRCASLALALLCITWSSALGPLSPFFFTGAVVHTVAVYVGEELIP